MKHIKVNFPDSAESEVSGNGEGMWVLVDDETAQAYDSDATGGHYHGVLDNDSIDWPYLIHGTIVEFEMRGELRPVAFFEWLSMHNKLMSGYARMCEDSDLG